MSVQVRIPGMWRGLTGGEAAPQVSGESVGAALSHLADRYPELRELLFTGNGELKPHLHVFLNQTDIRSLAGAATAVADGDEILLLMALAGG